MNVLIVGATSGIGKRLAQLYVEKGYRVGITGRRNELLQQISNSMPGKIITACYDVTKNENTSQLNKLAEQLGGVDILIISAGGGDISKELDWDIEKRTVDTNVNGFVETAGWAFNYFMKRGKGKLATISSIASYRGNKWAPAYSASKAFQSVYFEGLYLKARSINKNITVTCIEPGFVDTAMAKSDKLFWLVPVDKAAKQIIHAIDKGKKLAYISRRWYIIAKFLKWAPGWMLRIIGY